MSLRDPIPDLKRELAAALTESLRGWTPTAAYYMGLIDPSRLSDLRHGRLTRFSVEKLIRLLAQRGFVVSVTIERERR